MKVTRIFTLERVAKKTGGDRYQQTPGSDSSISETIYINQAVSRRIDGKARTKLVITVESAEE